MVLRVSVTDKKIEIAHGRLDEKSNFQADERRVVLVSAAVPTVIRALDLALTADGTNITLGEVFLREDETLRIFLNQHREIEIRHFQFDQEKHEWLPQQDGIVFSRGHVSDIMRELDKGLERIKKANK